jgi:hypothetical protein
MALDPAFEAQIKDDPICKKYKLVLPILKHGDDVIDGKDDWKDLEIALGLFCDYGKNVAKWDYQPTGAVSVEKVLNGAEKRVDCTSLAGMLSKVGELLVNMQSNDIAFGVDKVMPPDGCGRIVTKKGLKSFDGGVGDPGIEGRWCFGDHWIVRFSDKKKKLEKVLDPTFNISYDFKDLAKQYLGWYGLESTDSALFHDVYVKYVKGKGEIEKPKDDEKKIYLDRKDGKYTFDEDAASLTIAERWEKFKKGVKNKFANVDKDVKLYNR